jgi:hypothetical protein
MCLNPPTQSQNLVSPRAGESRYSDDRIKGRSLKAADQCKQLILVKRVESDVITPNRVIGAGTLHRVQEQSVARLPRRQNHDRYDKGGDQN